MCAIISFLYSWSMGFRLLIKSILSWMGVKCLFFFKLTHFSLIENMQLNIFHIVTTFKVSNILN